MSVVLGIDTGGTFTDLVLIDHDQGVLAVAKVPSTPGDPAAAILSGLAQLAGVERAERVVIGTTVATNAVLERRGPRVLFVTNRGFSDVPFIGRLDKERIYDLNWQKPKPLIGRQDSYGIAGRLDHHGNEITPLDAGDLEALGMRLASMAQTDVAVAICMLFSYLGNEHERGVAAVLRRALPNIEISMSHEVSPIWREYERASTTIADAFVKPVVSRYVKGVTSAIEARMSATRWNLLASNGGHLLAEEARRRPAQLLISGLAGGVVGGGHFARMAGYDNAFTLDMGGTSSDIGLVLGGQQQYAKEFQIDFGLPVTLPSVAVRTIGAGGGSIGWTDKGGLLHVGPQSAGAEPGPVAYGRGGTEPTVTDANLVLGRLDPAYFLGGAMKVDAAAAHNALARLGDGLGLSAERAALSVVGSVDENMANAIRLIAVERGLDVRDFALIAFGGAGPLHARAVAERLGMKSVVVPTYPGLCSAFGAAIAEARVDRVQTFFVHSENVDFDSLANALRQLRDQAIAELRLSVDAGEPVVNCSAEMRYAGQNHEIEVALPASEITPENWKDVLIAFAMRHRELYGFDLPDDPIELINLHVAALELRQQVAYDAAPDLPRDAVAANRQVWFTATGPMPCAIYRRSELPKGAVITGPAIVEQVDSTTVVFPGDTMRVGAGDIMILTLGDI